MWMMTLSRTVTLIVLLALWWLASTAVGPNWIPTPWLTFQAIGPLLADGQLPEAVLASLIVYLSGYAVAIVLGVPVGLFLGGFRFLGRTLDPFLNALMATPRVAFIPLIIILLGLGLKAKIVIIALGAIMPILMNTYAGVLNADGELVEMARATGASRGQVFRKILLPGALPFVVVGLRVGATIGLINTVVAELYTAVTGLGGLLATYGNTFQMAPYFVVVIVLALIGLIVTQFLRLLELRMERWRYDGG